MKCWTVKIFKVSEVQGRDQASELLQKGWEPFAATSVPGEFSYSEPTHFLWLRRSGMRITIPVETKKNKEAKKK